MKMIVNGSERELANSAMLADLLEELALDARGIAVAVNDVVIARSRYGEHALREGDRVEVIHAVAGG